MDWRNTRMKYGFVELVVILFLLIKDVIMWFLMSSVSLEFLLTWSSVFSSSSCIFFCCSVNFCWRAFDSLVRLLILFWSCLAIDAAASAFLSIVSILVLSLSDIHFFYYFFSYFLCIIFISLVTLTKVKYTSNILELCFQSIFEVYFKSIWSIWSTFCEIKSVFQCKLEVYFKYALSIIKSVLFRSIL